MDEKTYANKIIPKDNSKFLHKLHFNNPECNAVAPQAKLLVRLEI